MPLFDRVVLQSGSRETVTQQEIGDWRGLNEGKEALSIEKGHWETVPSLKSDHEKADTRFLLHAKNAVQDGVRIIIQSPDTDVVVLCTSLFQEIGCEELWFRTGVKDELRYIPVHDVSLSIGLNEAFSWNS